MAVSNIQSWADNLELVRLPAIEAEQDDLAQDLAAFTQSWADALDSNIVHTNAAISTANSALLAAQDTSTEVYDHKLYLETYVNNRIQQLQDHIDAQLAALGDYLSGPLQEHIDEQIGGVLPGLTDEVNANSNFVNTLAAQIQADFDEAQASLDQLMNIDVPAARAAYDVANQAMDDLHLLVNSMFQDLVGVNVQDSLEKTKVQIDDQLKSMTNHFIRPPHTSWIQDPHNGVLTPKTPVLPDWFVTNDSTFLDCIELPLNQQTRIGPAYPQELSETAIYKITVRLKVVNNGSGSVKVSLGVRTFADNTASSSATEKFIATGLTTADGEQVLSGIFSRDTAKLTELGLSIGSSATSDARAIPTAGNKAFFYLRQNSGTGSTGQIRVKSFKIEDMTTAASAELFAAGAAQSASESGVSAAASFSYMSAAQTFANDAEQSAQAAESERLLAQTARSDAQSFRDTTLSAKNDAEGSASTALTQAGIATSAKNTAVDAADDALAAKQASIDAASAAATSASTATSKATEAGNSASSATLSANTAEAKSQSTIQALESVQAAITNAVVLMPSVPTDAVKAFGISGAGTTTSFAALNGSEYSSDTDGLRARRLMSNTGNALTTRGVAPTGSDKVYRLTAKIKSPVAGNFSFRVFYIDQSGTAITGQTFETTAVAANTFVTFSAVIGSAAGGLVTRVASSPSNWANPLYSLRFGVRTETISAGNYFYLYDFKIEDFTAADKASRKAAEADQSAFAAAESATSASSFADDSFQYAEAALDSKLKAEAARGTAESYRDEAVQAFSDANEAKITAVNQAGLATDAADIADQRATAANNSALQAASSKTDAENAASAAANSATLSATAAGAAESAATGNLMTDFDYSQVVKWGSSLGASFARSEHGQAGTLSLYAARAIATDGNGGVYLPAARAVPGGNRRYSISGKYRTSGTIGTVYVAAVGTVNGSASTYDGPSIGGEQANFTSFSVEDLVVEDHNEIKFRGYFSGGAATGTKWVEFTDIVLRDMTDAVNSAEAAAAASISKSDAVLAKLDAEKASAAAGSALTITSRVVSQGVGVLRDQFLGEDSGWINWTSGPTWDDNSLWPQGREANWNLAAGASGGMYLRSTDAAWVGLKGAEAYYIEVDFTHNSGSLERAGVVLDWDMVGQADRRVMKKFSDMVATPIVGGQQNTARAIFVKPANATAAFSKHDLFIMASFSSFGGTADAVNLTVHRVFVRAATAEETGGGEVLSSLSQIFRTSSQVDQAIVQGINTYDASVPGGVAAKVTSSAAAISNLEGFAAATATLTAELSNGKIAGLRATAYDGAGGASSGSLLELLGDEVLAEGSISTNKLTVGLGVNNVVDPEFTSDLVHWAFGGNSTAGSQSSLSIRNPGSSWAGAYYPTMQLYQSGTSTSGYAFVYNQAVLKNGTVSNLMMPVVAGEYIDVSVQASTHRCSGHILLQFYNAAGAVVSGVNAVTIPLNVTSNSENPDAWPRYGIKYLVPANAKFVRMGIRKNATSSGPDSYLIFHKPMLARTSSLSTELTPYSPPGLTYIHGGKLVSNSITAEKLAVAELSAITANMGSIQVGTLNIAGNAVTVQTYLYSGGTTPQLTTGGLSAISGSITRTAGLSTWITFCCQMYSNDYGEAQLQLKRGSTVIETIDVGTGPVGASVSVMFQFVDTDTAGGATTYEVVAKHLGFTAPYLYKRSLTLHQFKR